MTGMGLRREEAVVPMYATHLNVVEANMLDVHPL